MIQKNDKPVDSNQEVVNKLSIICKLLSLQLRSRIEELKKELLKTDQQMKAYNALDGEKSIKDLASIAGYSNTRALESLLPEWEKKGFIISFGKGPYKRYLNIENLEV
jgi:hypothetical protein